MKISCSDLKKILKEIFYHYVAGAYTVNNVAVYYLPWEMVIDNLITWAAEELKNVTPNTMEVEVPSNLVAGLLAVCLLYANWKSYYKVTKEYFEGTTAGSDHLASSIQTQLPAEQYHGSFWKKAVNKTSAWGGAIMKAGAACISGYSIINKLTNSPFAITTTALSLPACIISQLAFLSKEEQSPSGNNSAYIAINSHS